MLVKVIVVMLWESDDAGLACVTVVVLGPLEDVGETVSVVV